MPSLSQAAGSSTRPTSAIAVRHVNAFARSEDLARVGRRFSLGRSPAASATGDIRRKPHRADRRTRVINEGPACY